QDITVSPGSAAAFTVNAVGPTPLNYQWMRNGSMIAQATNSAYGLAIAQHADLGLYSVSVSNAYDSVTSASAALSFDSSAVFFDNFEAGLGKWTIAPGATALTNSTTQKHSGTNSALCSNSSGEMYHNLQFAVQGHARLTFWAYDNPGSLSNWFGE